MADPSILYIAQNLDRSEYHMLLAIHRQGLRVKLLLDPDNAYFPRAVADGVPAAGLKLPGRYSLQAIRTIRREIRDGKFQIVHCLRSNRPLSNAVIAARGLPVKLIAYRGTSGHLSRLDPASRMTYLHPSVDRVVCVSNAVRTYLRTLKLPEERLVTIYKGHDPSWYQSDVSSDLSELGIPADAFVVGCAAAMRPVKGIPFLIRAMSHVQDAPRDVHLLLLGEVRDPGIGRALKEIRHPERVHLPGHREDASALMGACNAICMPTLEREGLPRAVIEAMSQAVPPVVSSVGGMVELVENEESGLIVPPGDSAALGSAISRLAGDPVLCKSLGESAHLRIQNEFNIARTIEKTMTLYRELC